jgi:RNA polymerase sigma-70 factor (ECF subfamily)
VNNFPINDEATSYRQRNRNALDATKPSETSGKETAGYGQWSDLVHRIQIGQTDGMEELYQIFSKGIRFYFRRNTGAQEAEDRMHDAFLLTVQAIRRGELREPERLMGFVQTVAQRQVAAHIRGLINARQGTEIEWGGEICAGGGGPEQAAMLQEREELVKRILAELSDRDREVLTRFYLKEQSPSRICLEMALTQTQFRLMKSRAKARFGELGKKRVVGHRLLTAVFAGSW